MSGGAAVSPAILRLLATLLLLLALVPILAPSLAQAQSRPAAEVFGVRFGVNDDTTRVVLDIDAETRFATRALASPPRLVIELENVRWQVRDHPQGRPVGLARTVNYGNLGAARGRLVIDIDRPFRIVRQDRLPPSGDARHHRILVDITPLDRAAPAAPAPQPTSPPAPAPTTTADAPAPASEPTRQPPRPTTTPTTRATAAATPIAGPPRARPTLPATAASATEAPTEAPSESKTVASLPLPGTNSLAIPLPAEDQPATTADPVAVPETGSADALDGGTAADGEIVVAVAPIGRPHAPPVRRRIIALDPGHGGADPGTIGINGVLEKEVTLDLAQRLRRLIEATGRYDVVLTRDEDVFVSLRDRMEIARRSDAALFISIHADSLGDSRLRGASVYTLSDEASDSEAARLARKENRADIIAGTDLSAHDQTVASILIDLAQRVTNNKSIEFADVLTSELADVTALVRNTRRFAGFVVLKSPDVPSVLLELGYLSNPTDAANLARPEYRDKLAKATLRAIDRYFGGADATL